MDQYPIYKSPQHFLYDPKPSDRTFNIEQVMTGFFGLQENI